MSMESFFNHAWLASNILSVGLWLAWSIYLSVFFISVHICEIQSSSVPTEIEVLRNWFRRVSIYKRLLSRWICNTEVALVHSIWYFIQAYVIVRCLFPMLSVSLPVYVLTKNLHFSRFGSNTHVSIAAIIRIQLVRLTVTVRNLIKRNTWRNLVSYFMARSLLRVFAVTQRRCHSMIRLCAICRGSK